MCGGGWGGGGMGGTRDQMVDGEGTNLNLEGLQAGCSHTIFRKSIPFT